MTNNEQAAELAELWELSEQGKAEWWPELIRKSKTRPFYEVSIVVLDGEHHIIPTNYILDIVRGEACDWLPSRGWFRNDNLKWVHIECYKDSAYNEIEGISLADAIHAEMGRGG